MNSSVNFEVCVCVYLWLCYRKGANKNVVLFKIFQNSQVIRFARSEFGARSGNKSNFHTYYIRTVNFNRLWFLLFLSTNYFIYKNIHCFRVCIVILSFFLSLSKEMM